MVDSLFPLRPVSDQELRSRFEPYRQCAESGELAVTLLEPSDKLAPPTAEQVPGTLSQMVSYRQHDCDNELARAHRYVRPDGTLGGSGKPDPKLVLQDGILYGQRRKRQLI